MDLKNEETLAQKLEEINEKLNVEMKEQRNIQTDLKQKNKVIMQRINKLQEYNEIDDMRNKILSQQLQLILAKLAEICEKLY